jgi:malonyl-CoA decarboxylase
VSPASFLRRLLGRERPPVGQAAAHVVALCEALMGDRGEISGAALAREALAAYQALDERGREEFFDVLGREFAPSPEAIGKAADAYRYEPGWRGIEIDLLHLFRSWFNRGFLRLERIDWRTSASVLEKLIQYEAVHAIQGWQDLRRRLEAADRRCFGFFHPQLRDEPLIFIEVALTHGMSAQVQPLLDINAPVIAPARADCAIFYSITNCQEGLRGTSFGNLLIKQVAEDLKRELPHLRTFATLSPVPALRRWLARPDTQVKLSIGPNAEERLALLARIEQAGWHMGEVAEPLQKLLLRLGAWYLLNAKQKGKAEPFDPVARFHLGNGAALERLNWLGDTSEAGMARSAGMMVNYVYRLEDVERNHERYFADHAVVASRAVEKLARKCALAATAAKPAEV